MAHLGTEDQWYIFRAKADDFVNAYVALSPDPRVLMYQSDLKFICAVLPYGRLHFEHVEETDWKKYSEKIREMLEEHLDVTGLKMVCKLRSLSDPAFWDDFKTEADIKTAAVRKLAELKKETSERASKNAARYEKFSDRIKALIKQFSAGLIEADEVLEMSEAIAKALLAEDEAHVGSGLNERAYGIAAVLEKFAASISAASEASLTPVQQAAAEIDSLYTSEASAAPYWQDKTELRKELRGQVRRPIRGARVGPGPRDEDRRHPRHGEVVVPWAALDGPKGVTAYVHQKRRWVFNAVREIHEKHQALLQQQYASGAKLQYRGRWLMLDVQPGDVANVQIACRSKFHVVVPPGLEGGARFDAVRSAFDVWLRQRALEAVERSRPTPGGRLAVAAALPRLRHEGTVGLLRSRPGGPSPLAARAGPRPGLGVRRRPRGRAPPSPKPLPRVLGDVGADVAGLGGA
ncbi:MAG: DUF3387 domain-containing protein [Deltaproteobacteria bacterium]|nr:DUF3387 domain-containing protein [Deltaproteobacteria bacterium]